MLRWLTQFHCFVDEVQDVTFLLLDLILPHMSSVMILLLTRWRCSGLLREHILQVVFFFVVVQ